MTILLFHRVTDQIREDGLTVSTARFRAVCSLLRRRFRVVPLAEVFEVLHPGRTMPSRTVAVTFDDCYRDNLFAARVLAEHGLPASFFVPTAYVGTNRLFPWDSHLPRMANLTWDDVREMVHMGHEIGSHTVNHINLGNAAHNEVRTELFESKAVLERQLGQKVRMVRLSLRRAEQHAGRIRPRWWKRRAMRGAYRATAASFTPAPTTKSYREIHRLAIKNCSICSCIYAAASNGFTR